MHVLLVFLGGGLGAMLRYLSNSYALKLFGAAFPVGTLLVNVVGSFVIGICVVVIGQKFSGSQKLHYLIITGVLGGFTTFSAFSLDFANLIERGQVASGFLYVLASVVLSLVAVFAGLWVARQFA